MPTTTDHGILNEGTEIKFVSAFMARCFYNCAAPEPAATPAFTQCLGGAKLQHVQPFFHSFHGPLNCFVVFWRIRLHEVDQCGCGFEKVHFKMSVDGQHPRSVLLAYFRPSRRN